MNRIESSENRMGQNHLKNLCAMVSREIGWQHWAQLLEHLTYLQAQTGGILRRSPRGSERRGRGEDETSPFLLFAPDRDAEGREFERILDNVVVYAGRSAESSRCEYPVWCRDDTQWWRKLNNRQKGVVIAVLGYIFEQLNTTDELEDVSDEPSGTVTSMMA
jgi:hypothetical protein